jgi:hypothetical protein
MTESSRYFDGFARFEWVGGWINGWMGGWMDGWVDGWMDVLLSRALTVGLILGFKSSSILRLCPVNMNIPAAIIGAFQMGPKPHDDDCIKNRPKNCD